MKQIRSIIAYRTFSQTDKNESILIDLRQSLSKKYGDFLYASEFNLLMFSIVDICKAITVDSNYGQ
jgi:hypothetical protein